MESDDEHRLSEARAQLRLAHERLRMAVEATELILFCQNRDLRYTWVANPEPGSSADAWLGNTDEDMFPPETAAELRELKEHVMRTGERLRRDIQTVFEGEARVHDTTIAPLRDEDGVIVGVRCAALEVTEQRLAEAERRQNRTLEALGYLAQAVAHDFRNLLMGIHGAAHMAADQCDDPAEVARLLDTIVDASQRGSSIAGQIYTFGRGTLDQQDSIELDAFLRASEPTVRLLLGEDSTLRVLPDAAGVHVGARRAALEQILLNLACNARDAMPEGGQLTMATRVDGDHVLWRVRDDGVGMDEATRARVFDPFFSTKPSKLGRGLGLATLRRQIDEMGGSVSIASAPGEGTCIEMRIPLAEKMTKRSEEPRPATPAGPTRARVLVVEDEELIRMTLRYFLAADGHEVLEAGSRSRAAEIVDGLRAAPDLVISDVLLPDGTGRELVDHARARAPEMPVLFLSAHDPELLRAREVLRPGDAFLGKPFTPEALRARVAEILDTSSDRSNEGS